MTDAELRAFIDWLDGQAELSLEDADEASRGSEDDYHYHKGEAAAFDRARHHLLELTNGGCGLTN